MVKTDEINADDEAEMTEDERIEEMIRQLIEEHLSEDFRKAALAWLEKRSAIYRAMGELQLLPDGPISSRSLGSSLDAPPNKAAPKKAAKRPKTAKAARARNYGGKAKRAGGGGG